MTGYIVSIHRRITDAGCANDGEHMKAIDSGNITIITLTSSCQRQHGLPLVLIILHCLMTFPSSRQESIFQVLPTNKSPNIHLHISISESVIPYVVGHQAVQTSTSYQNPTTCTSCESVSNIKFWTALHLASTKKTSTNHITNQYWISSSAWPYCGYG